MPNHQPVSKGRELWRRYGTASRSWLAANAPEILNSLQPGVSDEAIKQAEAFLGIELPKDVEASYRIPNGQCGEGYGLIDAWKFLSLERVIDEWMVWKVENIAFPKSMVDW